MSCLCCDCICRSEAEQEIPLEEWNNESEKFQLKHTVLVKGSYVSALYFTDDQVGRSEIRKYTGDHYQQVENVPHVVGLFKESEFVSSIVAEEEGTEISSDTKVPLSHEALQQQCVVHRVRVKTGVIGQQNLQLQIFTGNTKVHSYPFHVTLNPEDLYVTLQPSSNLPAEPSDPTENVYEKMDEYGPRRPKRGQNHSTTGKTFQMSQVILEKVSYVVVVYFSNDAAGEAEIQKYIRDQYNRVENVIHRASLDREAEFTSHVISEDGAAEISPTTEVPVSYEALQQQCVVHRVRIKTSAAGDYHFHLQLKMGNNVKLHYPFHITIGSEGLYGQTSLVRNASSHLHSSGFQNHQTNSYYDSVAEEPDPNVENRSPPSDFELRKTMEKNGIGHIWRLFERKKLSTLSSLMNMDDDQLKELGVSAYGDRRRVVRMIRNSSSQVNNAFENEEEINHRRPLPLPDQDPNIYASQEKIDLTEMLEKLKLENLMSVFEKERISLDVIKEMQPEDFTKLGIELSHAKKIKHAVMSDQGRNYVDESAYTEL